MPPNSSRSSESDLESVISQQEISKRRNAEPKYLCTEPGCGARFKRLDALDLHVYKHTGVKKHACTYGGCDKAYRTVTHLKRHFNTTHERTAPTPKTVACLISSCKLFFTSNTNMQRHMREVHENPKNYKCTHCAQTFKQKLKLRRHEITAHTGIYPYNCDKCGKGIYFRFQYEKHVASCKVYPCSDCAEVFEKWTVYLKHCREQQHGRKAYKCEHCPSSYRKPSALKEHVGAHHANDGKDAVYKCTIEGCEKSYAYERNLRQHTRISHGEKRFKCEVEDCDGEFKNKRELTKHSSQTHKSGRSAVTKTKKVISKKNRKDAGLSKVSTLANLSNLTVDKKLDDLLRIRNTEALDMTSEKLTEQICADDTETECSELEKTLDDEEKKIDNKI